VSRAKLFLLGQSLALLIASLPFMPIIPGSALYQGVGSASGHCIGRRMVSQRRFLVEDGKLYLLRQRTWRALALTTLVREVKWREADLQELRHRFPQLDDGTW
jgi:hypothetical protein